MERIKVSASTPYDVFIGEHLLSDLGSFIQELSAQHYKKIGLISDSNVSSLYAEQTAKGLVDAGFEVYTYVFPAGEPSKSMKYVTKMISWLCDHYFTRGDLLVALGGGVCGDLTGFVASIYLRGLDFIQVPTTLLAAIDSSVGGKTGVNIPEGKNLVGSFWQPKMVLCDTSTFQTLPERDFIDGIAEAIKTGCIWDKSLFDILSTSDWRKKDITSIVSRCVKIKAEVVAKDEKEHGVRQILNFGHTLGHAIEKLSQFGVSHGHAVAIGMCLIAQAGETKGITKKGTATEIKSALEVYKLPTTTEYSAQELNDACLGDKKRRGDSITFITLEEIGTYSLTPLSTEKIISFIEGGL